MGLTKLEIELHNNHNPDRPYVPGDTVSGKVILIVDSAYKAQALKLKFGGKEHVHWSEIRYHKYGTGENRRTDRETVYYVGNETLFQNEIILAGNGDDDFTLPPDRYEYPFRFQLPPQLPATFSSSFGSISYQLDVIIKRSWYKANDKASKALVVCGIYDLNQNGDASQPGEAIGNKTVCCLCWASGPIVAVIDIPRKGFVPGDVIPVQVEIQNNSTRDILEIKLALVQVVVHTAGSHYGKSSRTLNNQVATASRDGVQPGQSDTWRGDLLTVPHVQPTTTGKHIIDVWYHLYLEVRIAKARNLKLILPVYIGTVPLRRSVPKTASRMTVKASHKTRASSY